MKVLFINTFDVVGGAAIAAMRLSDGLQNYFKTENYFIVGHKKSDLKNIYASRNPIQKKIENALDILTNKIGLQYQFFPFSSSTIIKKAKELKPDIINLHNTHGGYFTINDLELLSTIAPIVWTLHDMWSFTGNAAHTFGDDSWKYLKNNKNLIKIYPSIGINTGSLLLKQKKRVYRNSNITVVTPSKWLLNLAKQSPVFNNIEINHINNGINLHIYRKLAELEKLKIRQKLNIRPEAKVLMFVAELIKSNNPWKGGSQLLKIIEGLNNKTDKNVELIIIGKGEIPTKPFQNLTIHNLGYVDSSSVMVEYLNIADVFIYPTNADNLPNVLIEAIACGTPCICNDIGGCNEVIINNYNGFVIQNGPDQFIENTMNLLYNLDRENFSSNCISHSMNFDLEAVSKQYYDLFNTILI